jgi:WD40 repeat protein
VVALILGLVGTIRFALSEAEQRRQAEHNARLASDEKQAALYQAYRARVAAAGAALQNHDVADAARHLDEEKALRDWEWRHLYSRLDDSFADLPAPFGKTFVLARGQQGLRLVTLTDQSVRVLDEQGHTERTIPFSPPSGNTWAVIQTPAGLLFLERVFGGVQRLRDETGRVRLSAKIPDATFIDYLCISPTLQWIAVSWLSPTGSATGLFDSSGKVQVRLPKLHTDRIWSLAFSPDSKRLATTSEDGTARLWDVATGQPIAGPVHHPGKLKVLSVSFCPDGARFLTTSADGSVCQWDATTGAAVEPPYERHTGEVWTAVYSPDGQWVASGGTDRTVRLWRARGAQEALVLHGHRARVTQLVFTGDGLRLGSVSEDGSARIWEVDPKVSLPVLRGHTKYVYPVACSPDGRWIASGGWDGFVRQWDALTGEMCAELRLGEVVRALAFSPDSSWLVTGCDGDGRLQIWDVATARLRRTIPGPGPSLGAVAVSPDGARIAAVAVEGLLMVVEVATGRELFRTGQMSALKGAVAYSPDGRWLAGTGADQKTICLRDARTHQLVSQLSGHTGPIYALAFSADGRHLASAGADRIVRVWEVATGACQAELPGHTDMVFAAAFHPGGKRLATAGRDQSVWLWDLTQGKEVARLQGHTNYIWALACSPDGKTLVSSSGDKTVRLWDTEPLRVRHRARRALAALRPEADRLLDQLFAANKDASRVVQALKTNEALSDLLRRAAFHALLRREQADR